MAKLEVGRALTVDRSDGQIHERARRFASLYGFEVVRDEPRIIELRRGGLLGELFSFDIQNVPTYLDLELERPAHGATLVTARLEARTRFGFFTSGDRVALEKQLDVLADTLRG